MTATTTRVRLRVSPGAGRAAIVGRHGDAWKVRVTEAPEHATANENHMGDLATDTLNREIDYSLGDNAGQVLSEIDAALKRIDDGTYGKCGKCGKEIPAERLEAVPWASLCIDDARNAE